MANAPLTLQINGPLTPTVADVSAIRPLDRRVSAPSVVWNEQLEFVPLPGNPKYDVQLFECRQDVVPKWYAVAVIGALDQALGNVHLFFHPTPGQAGKYADKDYARLGGHWPDLRKYVHVLAGQLAATSQSLILVVPFMTEGIKTTVGVLSEQWQDLLGQIQEGLCKRQGITVNRAVRELCLSSFSAGLCYLHSFLTRAPGLDGPLRAAFDFDGQLSTYRHLLKTLKVGRNARFLRYDQGAPGNARLRVAEADRLRFHVPGTRWKSLFQPKAPPPPLQLHGAIPRYMLYHAVMHERALRA